MNLYEIDSKIRELLENGFNEECIDLETGEILEDKAEALLAQYEVDRSVKIENTALYIKNLNAEAEAIKAEENALAARRKAKEKKANYLKVYLTNTLIGAEESKFESAKVALSFRKSTSVVITDENALTDDYKKRVEKWDADKAKIKADLQNGVAVPGAVLETKQNLQIK